MQVNRKKIPDKFYCEICKPRAVNSSRAKLKQTIYCRNLLKNKNKTNNNETNTSRANTPTKTAIYDDDDYEEYTSEEDDHLNEDENTNDTTNSDYHENETESETAKKFDYFSNQNNKTNFKNVSNNIDIYDPENDDINKLKDSELDGHNDRLMDEMNSNHADPTTNSCSSIASSPSTSHLKVVKKANNKLKKTNDDKENSNRMKKLKKNTNKLINKTKAKLESNNEDTDDEKSNDSIKLNATTNDNDSTTHISTKRKSPISLSEEFNFKKAKRNQYSNKFVKFQMKLTEQPNSSFNASSSNFNFSNSTGSNKSTISSILAASELSKQQQLNTNSSTNLSNENKIQVNKRGSLKDIVKNDCIKLFKISNSKEINSSKTTTLACRIKSTQNIESNQIIAEYIGKVMFLDEYTRKKEEAKNPFIVYYKLKLNETKLSQDENESNLCIDSSSVGSITRFIRKSCSSNCKLKHIIDSNGHLHFVIVSVTSISKGTEITLPYDYDNLFQSVDSPNESIDYNYCLCNCQNETCSLRCAINKIQSKNLETK